MLLHPLSSREPHGSEQASKRGCPGASLASHQMEDKAEKRGRKPEGEWPVLSRNRAGVSLPLREQRDNRQELEFLR